jgi:hypothetical protein
MVLSPGLTMVAVTCTGHRSTSRHGDSRLGMRRACPFFVRRNSSLRLRIRRPYYRTSNNDSPGLTRINFILSWFFGFRLLPTLLLLSLSDHRLVISSGSKQVVVGILRFLRDFPRDRKSRGRPLRSLQFDRGHHLRGNSSAAASAVTSNGSLSPANCRPIPNRPSPIGSQ